MSYIGLNTTPAERMRGCKFAEDFFNAAKITENGGTITGTPTFDGTGITLNGTTDYVQYAPAGTELNSATLSIILEFYPDFDLDEGVTRYLFDNTAASKTRIYVNGADGALRVVINGTAIAFIAKSLYEGYWSVGQKNTLVIYGVSGNTSIALNGIEIVSNATGTWVGFPSTDIYIGSTTAGTAFFDGKISKFQVYHSLLTEAEAIDFYNDSTYDYRKSVTTDLPCDSQRHDPTNSKILDLTFNGNDATLGDGITASLMPTKLSGRRGYSFDGVDDYISGLTAPTGNFTVTVMKRVGGVVSITQENDLTTWNQLFSTGGFTGELLTLRVHPSILTPLQEYDEQYWLNERLNVHNLPSGILSDLISEGACVLYHDYRSGSFRDWSENGNAGTPTGVSWATRAINYTSNSDKIVVPDAPELQTTEGSLIILGELFSVGSSVRLMTKRDVTDTQFYWSILSSTTMQMYDGSNFRTVTADPLNARYMAVNFAPGEKCEGFENGLSIGLYNDVSNITAYSADLWIGNSDVSAAYLQNCDLKAALYINRKLTAGEHLRLYADLDLDAWAGETYQKTTINPADLTDIEDPKLLALYGANPSAGTLQNRGYQYYPATVNYQTRRIGYLDSLNNGDIGTDRNAIDTGITGSVLNHATDDHTVSCWFRLTSLPVAPDAGGICGKGLLGIGGSFTLGGGIYVANSGGGGGLVHYAHYRTAPTAQYQDIPGPALSPNTWYHGVYVLDYPSNLASFYLDGVLQGTISIDTMYTNGTVQANGFRFFGVSSNTASLLDAPNTDIAMFSLHSEAKGAAWVAAQYQLGKGALWKTDGAVQESIANETTGTLSNTPFTIQSGTFKVSSDVIDTKPVKVIECVSAGVISLPTSLLNQSPNESAYGTWEFYLNKSAASSLFVAVVSDTSTWGSFSGYRLLVRGSDGVVSFQKFTSGAFTSSLFYTNSGFWSTGVFTRVNILRSSAGEFSIYRSGSLIPASGGGTNPVTDTAYTNSNYVVIELAAGDKFAYSDKSGNYSLIKRIIAEEV